MDVTPDFLSALAFNHSCQGPGCEVHERLHVQSISSAGQFTQAASVQSDELLIEQLALLCNPSGSSEVHALMDM